MTDTLISIQKQTKNVNVEINIRSTTIEYTPYMGLRGEPGPKGDQGPAGTLPLQKDFISIPLADINDNNINIYTTPKTLIPYFYYDAQLTRAILKMNAAPVGSPFIADIFLNDISLFPSFKPTISPDQSSASIYDLSSSSFLLHEGDSLSFSIDQVGSLFSGLYPIFILEFIKF